MINKFNYRSEKKIKHRFCKFQPQPQTIYPQFEIEHKIQSDDHTALFSLKRKSFAQWRKIKRRRYCDNVYPSLFLPFREEKGNGTRWEPLNISIHSENQAQD